jgi:hypothetical protein
MQAVKSLMLQVLTLIMGVTLLASPAVFASSASGLSTSACNYLNTSRSNTNTASPGNSSNSSISGCSSGEKLDTDNGLAHEIVNTILYVSGIISFIFILIGGFRYMTSTGDSSRIQSAKETLLYAIIGLVVTFLAIPISGFVIKAVSG